MSQNTQREPQEVPEKATTGRRALQATSPTPTPQGHLMRLGRWGLALWPGVGAEEMKEGEKVTVRKRKQVYGEKMGMQEGVLVMMISTGRSPCDSLPPSFPSQLSAKLCAPCRGYNDEHNSSNNKTTWPLPS